MKNVFTAVLVVIFMGCLTFWGCSKDDPTETPPPVTTTGSIYDVPANTEWTTTSLSVTAGQQVTITPSGTWRSGTWGTPVTYSATGHAGTHTGMTTYPFLCMIGKIGSSIFYVGNGLTFNAPVSGTLYLGPNDGMTADCWADNDGAITATVNGTGSSIPANTEWTSSGVTVTLGQSVTITPSGTWRSGTWATPVTYSATGDAGTHTDMTMRPFLCLIGKAGSTIFYVGAGGTMTMPATGTLYLGPNDGMTADCWADNDGALSVTVTPSK